MLSVARGWSVFDRFFGYIDDVLSPSESMLAEIIQADEAGAERFKMLTKRAAEGRSDETV